MCLLTRLSVSCVVAASDAAAGACVGSFRLMQASSSTSCRPSLRAQLPQSTRRLVCLPISRVSLPRRCPRTQTTGVYVCGRGVPVYLEETHAHTDPNTHLTDWTWLLESRYESAKAMRLEIEAL